MHEFLQNNLVEGGFEVYPFLVNIFASQDQARKLCLDLLV